MKVDRAMTFAGRKMTAAIFDIDGTLFDSMPIWEQLGNDFLLRQGIVPRENLAERFKTMSLQESAAYYQTHYGIQKTKEEIIKEINAMIREAYERNIPLKEGAYELLHVLKEKGILLSIATATDRELVLLALQRTGILSFFEGMVTCEEIGKSKAYPDIYEKAREQLGTKRETTWVIEDAYHAAATAKAARYPVIGVYDSMEKEQGKLKTLVDQYYMTLTQMRGGLIE